MNINASTRLQSLVHPDPTVRNTILNCCLNFRETDIQVTRKVIDAIDTHGLEHAYEYVYLIYTLNLDEASADWLIDLMEKTDGSTYFGNNALAHLTNWFVKKAPLSSLKIHQGRIAALPENIQSFSPKSIVEELATRAELATLTNEEIYQKICSHLDELDEDTALQDAKIPRLKRLLHSLDPNDQTLNSTILTELQSTLPDPNNQFNSNDWNFSAWAIASGHLRIEAAIPTLLQGMRIDWDWLNESIPDAIAQINSNTSLSLTADFYLQNLENSVEEYDFARCYLSGVFEKIESPLCTEIAHVLLQKETDDYTRVKLAEAIAIQFDSDSMPKAIEVYHEDPDDPERGHLLSYFYTHAILTDSNPSDLHHWKTKLDQEREKHHQCSQQGYSNDSMLAAFIQEHLQSTSPRQTNTVPITRTEEKIGRNAPCPCGSGKKHKRCCLK